MDAPIRDPETSNLTPSEAAQVPFSSEKLPSIEDTLQMARLANMVYEEKPIEAFKDAAKALKDDKDAAKALKDDKDAAKALAIKYKERLVAEGGADTEMWYYECKKEGTEAILTFSQTNNRCTVVFRGTETSGEAAMKDIKSDLSGLKKPLGPEGLLEPGEVALDIDHPKDCLVHQGFRSQYYGKVSEFRNDGAVDEELRADDGTDGIKGMVLETALLQKVEKVLNFQDKKGISDTKLFVTGHSLGAALSVLFGIRLAHKYDTRHVQVINFGCPKVGNEAFAQLVNNKANLCVQRVAHKNDVVTRVPNFYYYHVGHTIQIDEAAEPHAFKWHAGCSYWTNWNPFIGLLQGGVGDHSMETGYLAALNTHKHDVKNEDGSCSTTGEKPWVTAYKVAE